MLAHHDDAHLSARLRDNTAATAAAPPLPQ